MLLGVLAVVLGVQAAVPGDEIMSFPGWTGPLPSRQFSGYLDVSSTKHLHYVLVEAEGVAPATAPGYFYEHGPFRLTDDTPPRLQRFPFTWAKVANMLYLEAPVGVGFSYADNPADYQCTDDTTAQDNKLAIERFFALYPEYAKNEFFIAGESYGGVYVPTLAEAILWAAGNGTYSGAPLKGIAVGNGCSGTTIGVCGGERWKFGTQFLLGTAFVDPLTKVAIHAECDFTAAAPSLKCTSLMADMAAQIGHVDLYNVYGPCIDGSEPHRAGQIMHKVPVDERWQQLGGPDACIDSILASTYVNRDVVRSALHVHNTTGRWATCYTEPGWSYRSTRPNLPRDTYPALVKAIRVLIYNGDIDACVPHTDAESWTAGMGFQPDGLWHAWDYTLNAEGENTTQVGGYAVRYKVPEAGPEQGFTFITVKGGRHEVPETAPGQALEMITRMVQHQPF